MALPAHYREDEPARTGSAPPPDSLAALALEDDTDDLRPYRGRHAADDYAPDLPTLPAGLPLLDRP